MSHAFRLTLVCALALAGSAASAQAQQQAGAPASAAAVLPDIARVKARLAQSFVASAGSASEVAVDTLLATQAPDGLWPDLDQKYPPASQAGVSRYVHFLRVWKLAAAWASETGPERKAILADAIKRAFQARIHEPHPDSIPWFYLIGAPQAVARATLIFEQELTPEQIKAAIAVMRTCVLPDGSLYYGGTTATGQNLQHESEIQVVAGALERKLPYMAKYAALVEHEINVRDVEGLQVDWTFHQHGPQLYSGALYGIGFARDGAKLAWAFQGTRFAFRPKTVDALVHYVLDGQQWSARGAHFDFQTAGRLVAWPNFQGVEPEGDVGVADAARQLAELAPQRRGELLAFAARLGGQAPASSAPAGNRMFWQSDYMAHQRPGFFASVRMASRRVVTAESGSGQNELGYHLGDGSMGLMITGDDYHDIFPLWDWRRVPGVTAVYDPSAPLPKHQWGRGAKGWSEFAGGVSDDVLGASAMELYRGGAQAKKAWFFLDDAVFCLGAGITPSDPQQRMVTSIDQRWARGPVRSSFQPGELAPGKTHALQGPGWVQQGGITWVFPDKGEVRVATERKSAPWSSINKAAHGSMFRTTSLAELDAAGDVFSLWIEHGAGLFNPAGYAYIAAPGLDPSDLGAFLQRAPRIVANTADLQAIAGADLVQAVFWKAGKLALADGRRISVDRPGIVQLRRTSGDQWVLAAGNPTHRAGPFTVKLSSKWGKAATQRFDFPAGDYAGKSRMHLLHLKNWRPG